MIIDWAKVIPRKVRYFIWLDTLGRLPVSLNLVSRGISVQSNLCPLCESKPESVDHVLIQCKIAMETRNQILNWCAIPIKQFSNMKEYIEFAASWGNCKKNEGLLH